MKQSMRHFIRIKYIITPGVHQPVEVTNAVNRLLKHQLMATGGCVLQHIASNAAPSTKVSAHRGHIQIQIQQPTAVYDLLPGPNRHVERFAIGLVELKPDGAKA